MDTTASPCIRNCCLNHKDICIGCLRSLDEILLWGKANEQQKADILKTVAQRKQQAATHKPNS
ncbi:DUF1289 domain-containing protein [Dasania marina]|uniref:DUF1289 domain-containing protein n=1 Tax=Dasania marina TaxID=471499 RepID=UPI0030DBD5FD|tara:strand:+ start:29901 stop:30089 length:189 start_codon:yes stop_codon:yes gene_type:complete